MTGERKWFSWLLVVMLMLLVLSASIAFPLVCRPFYYAHIQALDLPSHTGWTGEEIREAFDEMMDFCIYGSPFGTGVLRWSEAGMQHFADCAKLFRLDFVVLGLSGVGLVACGLLRRRGLRPAPLLGHGPGFWAGIFLTVGFATVAGLAALDFDRAFVVFHQIFFPGTSNWIFEPQKDEIIQILPEVFFRNCAILIVAVLFLFCGCLVWFELRERKRGSSR